MTRARHLFPGPGTLDRALHLVRFLREECPWDAEQTAESLIPHLLEETHEVVDAIRAGDSDGLEGELGDLLLNLAFQIVVAEEGGRIDAYSVYARLESKMIARHPHLFGEEERLGDGERLERGRRLGDGERRSWEERKVAERPAGQSVLTGLASGLDPLTKSYRMQERVAAVGFDWKDHRGPAAKVTEELAEATAAIDAGDERAVVEEIGDLLFAAVNLARLAGVHPTTALSRANEKFRERFGRLERLAAERGIDPRQAGLDVLDGIWDELKAEEG